ncbi:MAG TPA: 4Fe-4S dicluster domain-containing protein, partial [Polyangiaceae bacterium]|nr:4Fe-4S dicluster domain-containing protein [Polyangiaceae bacterium]
VAALAEAVDANARTGSDQPALAQLDAEARRWVTALARDLRARAPGRTLVVVGERQPPEAQVLSLAINAALGNLGHSLQWTEQACSDHQSDQTLAELTREMHAGAVESLLILEANPSYDAPPDSAWKEAMARVKHSAYCGLYFNETASACQWFGPLSHAFETWADARAYDGTLTYAQPLIHRLHDSKSASEVLALVGGLPAADDLTRLRVRYGASRGEDITLDSSAAERHEREDPRVRASWEEMLALGFEPGSAFPSLAPGLRQDAVQAARSRILTSAPAAGLEINLLPSPTLHDGRFSNVSWLLELPDPIMKLTWDNAAIMSPATAERLGIEGPRSELEHGMIELAHGGRAVKVPAMIVPGHADESISLWLGYGREGEERLARGVGVNAYPLRSASAPAFAAPLAVRVLPEHRALAITQPHHDMHDRPLALATTLEAYRQDPGFTKEHKGHVWTLLPEYELAGPQWAMSIDLSICTGCSACMVACQAENNLPVVGKPQVLKSRAMHWLRIDTYYARQGDRPAVIHQPMMCQHCEKAPCEYVCPVNATVHSTDGLNEMVYNRCIGTRFCSNNCPYKVRRFNWFNWYVHQDANQGQVELQRNPDVSVRERGVMEKCTYCVQRIRRAEIAARIERREIRPGEVVTACQQACP